MSRRHFATGIIVSLLVAPIAVARSERHQQSNKPLEKRNASESREEKERRQTLEKRALALLNETVKEAQSLRVPENRIRVLATAADMLWDLDQERARSLFKLATGGLREVQQREESLARQPGELEVVNPYQPFDEQFIRGGQQRAQLREEILNLISRHDVRLAREFLTATRPAADDVSSVIYARDPGLELNFAAQIADTDPGEALTIAEQALERGLDYQLPNIVSRLIATDKDRAARLADEIVDKLRSEDLSKNSNAAGIAVSLLHLTIGNGEASQTNGADPAALKPLSENLVSDLIRMAVTAAAKSADQSPGADDADEGEDSQLLAALKTMLPAVQRYAPSSYSALKSKLDDLDKTDNRQAAAEYQRIMQNGSLDDLLAAAAKAPAGQQADIYMRAAYKAASDGDVERAREIVNKYISDPNRRRLVLASINQQALWHLAEEGKLDQARPMLSRMSPDARAAVLLGFANTAVRHGDKKLALLVLGEARGLIDPVPINFIQVQNQISIASTYAAVDPATSFSLLEPLIGQLEGLLSALSVLDGFEYGRHFREGELDNQTSSQLIILSFQCARSLSSLAGFDFERAKACAEGFQRPELRAVARLSVAQGILSNQRTLTVTSHQAIRFSGKP